MSTKNFEKYDDDFKRKALKLEYEIGTVKAARLLHTSEGQFRKWRKDRPELRHPGAPLVYPRGRGAMGKTMDVTPEGRFVRATPVEPKTDPKAPSKTSAAPNSRSLDEVKMAIALAEEIGLRPAAIRLGMAFSTLRNWRINMRRYGRISIPQSVRYASQRPSRRVTPVEPEPKIQRAARRAPLQEMKAIPSSGSVFHDLGMSDPLESTFERGFHRGFNSAITLFKIDLTGEEGANDE